jgi:glutathione synthase/RimK-type ligase-like ATP-grasp enzyme
LSRGPSGIDRKAYYREGWLEAARRLDIEFIDLGSGFLRLSAAHGGTTFHGAEVGVDDIATYHLAGDKQLTDQLMRDAGIPRPTCSIHAAGASALTDELRRSGWMHVIKPAAGSGGGRGVTVSPGSRNMALRAIVEASAYGSQIMCEEHQSGRVCRALVFDGEVLDAVVRGPANVTGDGELSVAQLVKMENRRRATLGDKATGFIEVGTDFLATLSHQELGRSDVPRRGQRVAVSGRSNSGSELETCRLELDLPGQATAALAADAVGVRLAGVDLVLDAADAVASVLEVNTTPGLHWHTLVRNEPYDVFTQILKRVVAR